MDKLQEIKNRFDSAAKFENKELYGTWKYELPIADMAYILQLVKHNVRHWKNHGHISTAFLN
jgi:hypothetical protein